MKLKDLLREVPVTELHADSEMEIGEVFYDSRKVTPGSLFVAVSGFASDGNRFIPMALQKGAAVVVTARRPQEEIPYVLVESDRLALALISANYFGRPAQRMQVIGVTGTNGKTSVTLLLKQVLEKCLGAKVGLVGTMGNLIGDEMIPTERTTPESFELQALFARMADAGCAYAVMEVSSHAVSLERIGGIRFAAAAFTNLTEDHLDFHKTMDAYCDAKAELFRRCDRAVVNIDDSYAGRILRACACPVITTSDGERGPDGTGCGASRRGYRLYRGNARGGGSCKAGYSRQVYGVQRPDGAGPGDEPGDSLGPLRRRPGRRPWRQGPGGGGSHPRNALFRPH